MAAKDAQVADAQAAGGVEAFGIARAAAIDYAAMTKDQLIQAIGKAFGDGEFKLMGKLSVLMAKAEAVEEKAKKDALQAELAAITITVTDVVVEAITGLIDEGKLDGAEGIWFAWDFGAVREAGTNPACKLMKATRRVAESSSGASTSSYVSGLPSSEAMLGEVGTRIMFTEDTAVTIDKQKHTIKAGTTFRQAYDYSSNGGWRNRVRMAIGKETGRI